MNPDRRSQNAIPLGGVVSMTFPDMETNLFGLGLLLALNG
jgi:hypothetical protein